MAKETLRNNLKTNDIYRILSDWENKPDILLLIKNGVISMAVIDALTIFEYYKSGHSVIETAYEYNVARKTVYRAIRMFTV